MIKKKSTKIVKPSQPTDLEYIRMFDDCVINKSKTGTLDKAIDNHVNANRNRYTDISNLVAGRSSSISLFGFSSNLKANNPFDLKFEMPSLFNSQPPTFDLKNSFNNKSIFDNNLTNLSLGSSQVPWYFIACAHYLECTFSFKHHLHNGDPLSGYTVRVPPNRPKVGHPPPFTFEESAVDALKLMKFHQIYNWNLATVLRKLEAYNGFGYYKYHSINSPYLWSFSNQYNKGKYVADGKFDAQAISQQMGAAVILKRMEERSLIYIPRH